MGKQILKEEAQRIAELYENIKGFNKLSESDFSFIMNFQERQAKIRRYTCRIRKLSKPLFNGSMNILSLCTLLFTTKLNSGKNI